MSSDFKRRFQGRATILDKNGISGLVQGTLTPVQKPMQREYTPQQKPFYNTHAVEQMNYPPPQMRMAQTPTDSYQRSKGYGNNYNDNEGKYSQNEEQSNENEYKKKVDL